MSEWIKYDGSDKQIEEILGSKNGFSYIRKSCDTSTIDTYRFPLTRKHLVGILEDCEKYLIHDPHPYADLIKIWADTGCPVYAKHRETGHTCVLQGPRIDWNYEEWEFSITPFED